MRIHVYEESVLQVFVCLVSQGVAWIRRIKWVQYTSLPVSLCEPHDTSKSLPVGLTYDTIWYVPEGAKVWDVSTCAMRICRYAG